MRALALASVALGIALRATAGPPPPDPATQRAKELFAHAEALYALLKFDEALAEYERAFEAKPLPGLLFNIAQCNRNLGRHERAIHFYRAYLERQPGARNRDLVESLIAESQQALSARPDAAAPPSAPAAVLPSAAATSSPIEPASVPLHRRWYLWAGAAGLLAAVVVTALAIGFATGGPPRGTLSTVDAR